MIELQWIIVIALIEIASPLWVYGDAKEGGISDRGLWTLLAFLLPIAGLVLYLLLGRKPSEEKRVCPHCGSSITAQYAYCPSCGAQSSKGGATSPEQLQKANMTHCRFCGTQFSLNDKFCRICGRSRQARPTMSFNSSKAGS